MSRHLEELRAKHAAELAAAEREETVFALVPDTIAITPTVSNVRANPDPIEPAAWLTFSEPYAHQDRGTHTAEAIFAALETAGWRLAPTALVKWDRYRHAPIPLAADAVPEKAQRYTRTEALPIASVWVRPNQHTGPEVEAFMTAPDGRTYRVAAYSGKLRCYVHCKRHEYRGGWVFEGDAKLAYPSSYNAAPLAVHHQSRAFRDSEQGISGAVYFEPTDATAAELAHALETNPIAQPTGN